MFPNSLKLLSTFIRQPRAAQRFLSSAHQTPEHKVSAFDNFILRVTGVVSKSDPSATVSVQKMEKATSRFRIGLMFFMMVFCGVGSAYAIALGKKDHKNNINSLAQQNRDRHAKAGNK